ncbi:FHA domain-containing protein, partial [bacterium]|nr:FHA domain-containing protein [bacterium]
MAKLIVQNGIHAGAVFELGETPVVIGRDFGCDIHLPDAQVARRHARIELDGERFVVFDLGGRNGTFVNDKRTEQEPLGSGDRIAVGEVAVVFVGDDAAHELPPEDPQWVRPTVADTIVSDRIELLSRGLVTYSREQLEHANEGLITLFRYATVAPEAKTVEELLDLLSLAVEEAIGPDRVAPILLDPDTDARRPWLRRASAFDRQLAKVPVSTTLIDFVFRERLSVLSHAPADDERPRDVPSPQLNRIATAICVPLRMEDRLLGAVYADRLGDGKPFTRTDLEVLTALAIPTAVALQNIRWHETLQRERQVLEREVRGQHRLVGDDARFETVFDFIEKTASLDSGILILGERGTGKELVARAIHYSSPRAKGPFESV